MSAGTVYLLWLDVEYEFGEPLGVFSSEELALEAADRISKPSPKHPWKKDPVPGFWERRDSRHTAGVLTVEPFVLDDAVDV